MKVKRFLKLKQAELNDRKRLSKSRYSTTFQLRFVSTERSLFKIFAIKKKDFQIYCLLKESASILEQANQTELRRFKLS